LTKQLVVDTVAAGNAVKPSMARRDLPRTPSAPRPAEAPCAPATSAACFPAARVPGD